MPAFTTWTIRASLGYLALGFTLGALLLFHKGIPLSPTLWLALPAHIEFLLIGWTVQLIMGMAFWILPRFKQAPKRGDERLAWISFGLLNLGIWLVSLYPLASQFAWLSLFGRAVEVGAAITFALYAWPRVKPART